MLDKNKLTVSELRAMEGDKVSVEYIGSCKGFYDDEAGVYFGASEQLVVFKNGKAEAHRCPLEFYGQTWVAEPRFPKAPKYGKLVRDNIPNIIVAHGETPITHELDKVQAERFLRKKLLEEVHEFFESSELAELADIMEVIYALADLQGCSEGSLDQIRRDKRAFRGGFSRRLLLEGVAEDAVSDGPEYQYETGIETPEILGSGSVFSQVVRTVNNPTQ